MTKREKVARCRLNEYEYHILQQLAQQQEVTISEALRRLILHSKN